MHWLVVAVSYLLAVPADETVFPQALATLLDTLRDAAPPTGERDVPLNTRPLLFGYVLWDTGEATAGYSGEVADLVLDFQADPATASVFYGDIEQEEPSTPLEATLDAALYTTLFTEPWAAFDVVGRDQDFASAFGELAFGGMTPSHPFPNEPAINAFTTQNTITSIVDVPVDDEVTPPVDIDPVTYTFPSLEGTLAPAAAAFGLAVVQDVGFANNFVFPVGTYDFNVEHGIVTKYDKSTSYGWDPDVFDPDVRSPVLAGDWPRQVQFAKTPWYPFFEDVAGIDDSTSPFVHASSSIMHPDVARAVRLDVARRVSLLSSGLVGQLAPYYVVSGEYFTHSRAYQNEHGAGLVCCKDLQGNDIVAGGPVECACVDELGELVPCDGSEFDDTKGKCETLRALCEEGVEAASYFDCMPNVDYSAESYEHFRRWLEDGFDIAELRDRWGLDLPNCDDIASCELVDPLLLSFSQGNAETAAENAPAEAELDRIRADWRSFQDHQRGEAERHQYRAAKSVSPFAPMLTLSFDVPSQERAAIESDGVALGNWYQNNETRLDVHTPMKRRALHLQTYGRPVTFPLFGMPRDFAYLGYVEDLGVNPCFTPVANAPNTFQPPCWDYSFTLRVMRELLLLGTDSIGLTYWENVTGWTSSTDTFLPAAPDPPPPLPPADVDIEEPLDFELLNAARFTIRGGRFLPPSANPSLPPAGSQDDLLNMAEKMALEAAAWREELSFMTPWRSALLVHLGPDATNETSGNETGVYLKGTMSTVVDTLARDQVQFAPFTDDRALDDPWVTDQRVGLLSVFAEPDDGLADAYLVLAEERLWSLLVLADVDAIEALHQELDGDPDYDAGPLGRIADPNAPPGSMMFEGSPSSVVLDWAFLGFDKTQATANRMYLEAELLDLLSMLAEERELRPVTVRTEGGELASDVDLTLMSDGLSLLMAVASVREESGGQTVVLEVDPALPIPEGTTGWTFVGGSTVQNLGAEDWVGKKLGSDQFTVEPQGLGSVIRYTRAGLDAAQVPTPDLYDAVTCVGEALEARAAEGFDVDAARWIVERLEAFVEAHPLGSRDPPLEKLLAGLLRLWRMPLLRITEANENDVTLRVATILGETRDDVTVTRVYPLQNHARLTGGVELLPAGDYSVPAQLPAELTDEPVWDFESLAYETPSQVVLEIHVTTPDGAASMLTLDRTWVDLGSGKAGGDGTTPSLTGTGPLSDATSNQIAVAGTPPGAAVTFFIGTSRADVRLKGGVLVPVPTLAVQVVADATGALALPFETPSSLTAGSAYYMQAWMADRTAPQGVSATNALLIQP